MEIDPPLAEFIWPRLSLEDARPPPRVFAAEGQEHKSHGDDGEAREDETVMTGMLEGEALLD
jgi:hypothetical protein